MPHKSKDREVNREGPRDDEPEEIGKPHDDGSERARDEQRQDGGPRYGGGAWEVADERDAAERFGHARNDDADPSELTAGKHAVDDDEWPGHDASPQTDATGEDDHATKRASATDEGDTEHGGQREGMGRGEKPRKPAPREKNRA